MEPSPEIREAYTRFLDGVSSGTVPDQGFAASTGVSLIGTAPGEWFCGPDAVRQKLNEIAQAFPVMGMRLIPDAPEAWMIGDVGWVIDRPTFRRGDKEAPARITMVFLRQGTSWKPIHLHASFGTPDGEVLAFHQ